jgi:hypothetical protein
MLPFGALVVTYCVAVAWIAARLHAAPPQGALFSTLALAGIGSIAIILPPFRRYVRTVGRDSGSVVARARASWRAARADEWSTDAIRESAAAVALTTMLMAAFGTFKPLIPELHAYTWDATLAAMGSALHGGHHAYALLMPLFGSELATRAIDAFYYAGWTLMVWATFVWQVGVPAATRTQYLVTFALAWVVLGSVLAVACASAGPMYYDRVVPGPNPYAPLEQHLAAINARHPLIIADVQGALWSAYRNRVAIPGGGISAFPSLHVAMSELAAIVGRRSGSRPAAIGLTLLSLLTLAGSIHLGPHYAVDGYTSIVAIHVLWRVSGLLTGQPIGRRLAQLHPLTRVSASESRAAGADCSR